MPRSDARAGALDRPIEIQEPVEGKDIAGGVTFTWTRVAREWAAVESVDQSENYSADRMLAYKLKYFTIRWVSWLTARHRIVYDSENYNVLSISEMDSVGRDRFLRVLGELKV